MGALLKRRIVESGAFAQAFSKVAAKKSEAKTVQQADFFRSQYFQVSLRPQSDQTYPQSRLGLIIAKRFAKHAVDRNRIKRLIRQVFVVEDVGKIDFFVRLSKPLVVSSYAARLHEELVDLWGQINR